MNVCISVADPVCLSWILIFPIPDPGSASKNLSILTQKICFQPLGNMIRVVHPGSGSWFLTHPWSRYFTHPGSRGQKSTGSRIRNTGLYPYPSSWRPCTCGRWAPSCRRRGTRWPPAASAAGHPGSPPIQHLTSTSLTKYTLCCTQYTGTEPNQTCVWSSPCDTVKNRARRFRLRFLIKKFDVHPWNTGTLSTGTDT